MPIFFNTFKSFLKIRIDGLLENELHFEKIKLVNLSDPELSRDIQTLQYYI